jgi:hypothetical protein
MPLRVLSLVAATLFAALALAGPASARPPGTATLVTGTGFPKRARVSITIDAEGGRTARTRTDRRGRLQKPIWVPQGSPVGSFPIVACSRRCRSRATARLRIAANGTRWVRRGRIVPGVGAGPVNLGMTRAQVIARLGRPIFQTVHGYMQYAPDPVSQLFDVYTIGNEPSATVRQVVVSFGSFTIDGIAVFKRGALRRLADRYGSRLQRTTIESGEAIYRLKTSTAAGERWTDFLLDSQDRGLDARILNVIVLDPS